MTKTKKLILGILTFLPIIFAIYIMSTFMSMFGEIIEMENGGQAVQPDEFFGNMTTYFSKFMMLTVLSLGLLIYYIIDVINSEKFKDPANSSNKIIWILVIVFAGTLGQIAYFIVEIYPRPEPGVEIDTGLDDDIV